MIILSYMNHTYCTMDNIDNWSELEGKWSYTLVIEVLTRSHDLQ